MAEFSWTDRLIKIAAVAVLLVGWWYLAPDYSALLSTSITQLTIGEILWGVGWLLLILPLLYGAISLLYEAWTGRDSIWLWDPN